ncbi:hypothetical protein XAR_1881 [Xanthomonas citri pv. glycines str. 8ra]|nr:hypothetical protein XAR_1881 [Xanthomonas citri pv. glycines str. 8ra]
MVSACVAAAAVATGAADPADAAAAAVGTCRSVVSVSAFDVPGAFRDGRSASVDARGARCCAEFSGTGAVRAVGSWRASSVAASIGASPSSLAWASLAADAGRGGSPIASETRPAASAVAEADGIVVPGAGSCVSPDTGAWTPSCPGVPVGRCGDAATAAAGDGTRGACCASTGGGVAGGNAEPGAGMACSGGSTGGTSGVGTSGGAAGVARRNVARGRRGGGVSDIGRRAAGRPLFNHAHVQRRTCAGGDAINPQRACLQVLAPDPSGHGAVCVDADATRAAHAVSENGRRDSNASRRYAQAHPGSGGYS